jgi:hypothetical protein
MVLGIGFAPAADFSKTGSVGAQFLKIAVGSRYQGMGEASVAEVGDAYSMYWNPAGLTNIENSSVTFTSVDWIAGVSLNYVAFATRVEGFGVFGLSATLMSSGDMEITTVEQPEGTGEMFNASSFALTAGFARQLTNRLSFGTTLKYLYEKIYNESASGLAFDFGTQLHTGWRSLRIGMNIANMGTTMKFNGPDLLTPLDLEGGSTVNGSANIDSYDLPLIFRLGMAYDLVDNNMNRVTLALEAKHPNDNDQQAAFGTEYCYRDRYFLRGGYKFNYEEQGLTLGAGIITPMGETTQLMVDYAWADFDHLESVHRFSLSFNF